jgi:hypothetical protein
MSAKAEDTKSKAAPEELESCFSTVTWLRSKLSETRTGRVLLACKTAHNGQSTDAALGMIWDESERILAALRTVDAVQALLNDNSIIPYPLRDKLRRALRDMQESPPVTYGGERYTKYCEENGDW